MAFSYCTATPVSGPSYLVNNLPNGTTYYVTVAAVNAAGTGTASPVSTGTTTIGLPGAPTNLVVTAIRGQVSITWSPGASDGGSPITGYSVCVSTDPLPAWSSCSTITGATSLTRTGLPDRTTYYVDVAAVNVIGTGPFTPVVSGRTFGVPDSPPGLVVTPGLSQASLTWVSPWNGGYPITGYQVCMLPSPGYLAGLCASTPATTTSYTFTGLLPASAYSFTVSALNDLGPSQPSAPVSMRTPSVPGAPTSVKAKAADRSATLTWGAPSDGGSPIAAYMLCASNVSTMVSPTCQATSGPVTSATFTGLTPGMSYWFDVMAVNAVGSGPVSATTTAGVVPFGVPGAPSGVSATLGSQLAVISWQAPAVTNFSALKSFATVCTAPGLPTRSVSSGATTHSVKITALVAGATYSCTVSAVNAAGTGPASAPVIFVADHIPSRPPGVVFTRGDGQLTVSWSPSVTNGGSPVTSYSLSCTYVVGGVKTPVPIAGPVVSPMVLTGLTNGTPYSCTLVAHNAVGASPAVSKTLTPAGPPSVPLGVSVAPKPGAAVVSWSPPVSNGGAAISGYVVTCTSGATSVVVNAGSSLTSATVNHLTNGLAWDCTVAAKSTVGVGVASAPVETIPQPAPTVPKNVAATAVAGGAVVSFTAPVGAFPAPTGYTVACSGLVVGATGASVTDTSTSILVGGLVSGDPYSCIVQGFNDDGPSPWSTPVTVTPL
jgi:titin